MRQFKTWNTAIAAFLDDVRDGREEVTVNQIRKRLKHVCRISESPADLTRSKFVDWIESLKATKAPSYAKSILSDFKRLLEYVRHPLAPRVALYRVHAPDKPIKTYTEQELITISRWCMKEHTVRSKRRAAIYLAIAIGSALRADEICNLRWEYWEPHKRRFRVMETKTNVAGWAKVTQFAVPLIEAWREEVGGDWVIPSFLLPANPLGPNAMRTYLNKTLKEEIGLFELPTQKFRSTVAKLVFEDCRSLESTAAILRHKSIETTRQFYYRIEMDKESEEVHESAFEALNEKIENRGENDEPNSIE